MEEVDPVTQSDAGGDKDRRKRPGCDYCTLIKRINSVKWEKSFLAELI
jgi:hypothetical protein